MNKYDKKEIRKLFLSFILMILLTALAFFLVLYHLISPPFLIVFIIFFALIQILIQLDRFMDIREKEGEYRLTSLIGGSFVALLAIIFLILL
ncbi:cytochrome C oxidase subunit IV family protein [Bacillus sp. N1-1]|uniref:cytochrome C oxidase subunit IV family protein n=1 Tax=Bacillus sp. N1-1 TaxID=2682541 RepID=UPI001317EF64|nr:cytochrome C oxidase subunit IV family protein [Bacillus sp. N1-1]QHA92421.1 cytochrome C oxidase subunit IV [Bacillus sp. N1-1]